MPPTAPCSPRRCDQPRRSPRRRLPGMRRGAAALATRQRGLLLAGLRHPRAERPAGGTAGGASLRSDLPGMWRRLRRTADALAGLLLAPVHAPGGQPPLAGDARREDIARRGPGEGVRRAFRVRGGGAGRPGLPRVRRRLRRPHGQAGLLLAALPVAQCRATARSEAREVAPGADGMVDALVDAPKTPPRRSCIFNAMGGKVWRKRCPSNLSSRIYVDGRKLPILICHSVNLCASVH